MNDFADVNPAFWVDDSQVLVVRQTAAQPLRARGLLSDVRGMLSAALIGLSVAGLTALAVSSSDHIVRSSQVANERAENGVTRRYWEGLSRALDSAPTVQAYEESDEVAPLL